MTVVSRGLRHATPVSAAPPSGAISPRIAARTAARIQDSRAHRAADAAYRQKDVAGALRQVDALRTRTDLTAEDRAFLQRQQAICQARLDGKTAAPAPRVVHGAPVRSIRSVALRADQADCGPRALLIACREMNVAAALAPLRKAAGTTDRGTSLAGLISAAKSVGVTAKGVQMDGPALANLDTRKEPALAWVDGMHYVTVLSIHGDSATIHDPNHTGDEDIALTSGPTSLLARSGGILLLLSPGASKAGNPAAGI